MNRSSAASYKLNQAFSSGDRVFKLSSISHINKRQSIGIQIDIDSFINITKGSLQQSPINNIEDETTIKLFNLPNDCLVNVSGDTQYVSKDKKPGKKSSLNQTLIYEPIPITNKCLVCKQTFENYFQHIGNQVHKKRQKSYIQNSQNIKVSLDTLILKLKVSIDIQNKLDLKGQKIMGQNESQKRSRVYQSVDQPQCLSIPRKRRLGNHEALKSEAQILSTGLLNSNSFAQKESFFE